MNFNFDLFIDILWLGTLSGIISTICLQKLESTFLNHKLISIIINIIIGFCISRLFTNLSIKLSICVGFITWIGAETIYEKINSQKLLTNRNSSFSSLNQSEEKELQELQDFEDSKEPDNQIIDTPEENTDEDTQNNQED